MKKSIFKSSLELHSDPDYYLADPDEHREEIIEEFAKQKLVE